MNESAQHAEVHIFQASMAAGAQRKALLAEARDILISLETLEKGSGAWRLACISALESNSKLCRRWLERAHAHGTLPERSVLESDPYLSTMRSEKWFKHLLEKLGP